MKIICKECHKVFDTNNIEQSICSMCMNIFINNDKFMRFENQKLEDIKDKNLLLEG